MTVGSRILSLERGPVALIGLVMASRPAVAPARSIYVDENTSLPSNSVSAVAIGPTGALTL